MKKLIVSLAVGALVVGLSVGGALAKSEGQSATVQACVLLPDTKSSVRWETQDRPTFIAAFKKWTGVTPARWQRRTEAGTGPAGS